MAPHDAEHERRVREALLRPDGRSSAALDDCAQCRRELDELRWLSAELDGAAALERELLAEAEALADAPDAPPPDARDARHECPANRALPVEDERGAQRSLGRRIGWPAALAAAAALALFLARAPSLFRPSASAGPEAAGASQELVLGADGPASTDLGPSGAVPSFEVAFRWDLGSTADAGWFVLRVYSDEADARPGDPPLATSPRLDQPLWSWPAGLTRSWPRRIRWEVQAFDATGLPVGAIGARAWRTEPEGRQAEAERAR